MTVNRPNKVRTVFRERRVPAPAIEKHLQTGIQVLLVALILWSGNTTLELRDKVARMEEQLRSLQTASMTATADRYTRSQAQAEIGELKRRIEVIEGTVEKEHAAQREWLASLRDRQIRLEQGRPPGLSWPGARPEDFEK